MAIDVPVAETLNEYMADVSPTDDSGVEATANTREEEKLDANKALTASGAVPGLLESPDDGSKPAQVVDDEDGTATKLTQTSDDESSTGSILVGYDSFEDVVPPPNPATPQLIETEQVSLLDPFSNSSTPPSTGITPPKRQKQVRANRQPTKLLTLPTKPQHTQAISQLSLSQGTTPPGDPITDEFSAALLLRISNLEGALAASHNRVPSLEERLALYKSQNKVLKHTVAKVVRANATWEREFERLKTEIRDNYAVLRTRRQQKALDERDDATTELAILKGVLLAVELQRDDLKEKLRKTSEKIEQMESAGMYEKNNKQAELKALAKEREQRMQKIREARTGSSSSSNGGTWADDSESEAWFSACEN